MNNKRNRLIGVLILIGVIIYYVPEVKDKILNLVKSVKEL